MPWCTHPPCRTQERPPRRPARPGRDEKEIDALHNRQRREHRGARDWSTEISGMFILNGRRRGRRVRSCYQSGLVDIRERRTRRLLCHSVISRRGTTSHWLFMNKGLRVIWMLVALHCRCSLRCCVWVFDVYDHGGACTKSNRPASSRLSTATRRYQNPRGGCIDFEWSIRLSIRYGEVECCSPFDV